jgi:hypothetical protein
LAQVFESILSLPGAIQSQFRAMQRQADALDALAAAQNGSVFDQVWKGLLLLLDSMMSAHHQLLKKAEGLRASRARPYRESAELMSGVAVQLISLLERYGVRIVNEVNIAFDPEVHSIERIEPGTGPDPVVVEVLHPGFLFEERVIRKAVVAVGKPHSGLKKEVQADGSGVVSVPGFVDSDAGLPVPQRLSGHDS